MPLSTIPKAWRTGCNAANVSFQKMFESHARPILFPRLSQKGFPFTSKLPIFKLNLSCEFQLSTFAAPLAYSMPGGPMQGGPHRAGLVLSKREKIVNILWYPLASSVSIQNQLPLGSMRGPTKPAAKPSDWHGRFSLFFLRLLPRRRKDLPVPLAQFKQVSARSFYFSLLFFFFFRVFFSCEKIAAASEKSQKKWRKL